MDGQSWGVFSHSMPGWSRAYLSQRACLDQSQV
eukprot:SAG11_NODE_45211_length_147_cov_38.020833_1_plen_32_part_10